MLYHLCCQYLNSDTAAGFSNCIDHLELNTTIITTVLFINSSVFCITYLLFTVFTSCTLVIPTEAVVSVDGLICALWNVNVIVLLFLYDIFDIF